MESRVPQPKGKDNRKRKKSLEKPVVIEPVVAEEPVMEDPPPKRKRGRPPKKTEVAAPQAFQESDDSVMDDDNDDVGAPAEITPRPSVSGPTSRSTKRAKKESSSATDIIAKFEKQYHEVAKMYQEMGKTVALLKSTVREGQSNREQDIRDEVREEFMTEMQKRITKK
jgi:hypothetical protein